MHAQGVEMFSKLPRISAVAAIAAVTAVNLAAGPTEARDWLRSVERHYSASEANRYVPKGDNPQWDFNLNTMVNDMAWRTRTAAMLRDLPTPGEWRSDEAPGQQADSPALESPRFRF